ncbi:MAG: hypothetical protein AAGL68_05655, partial [Pseudomonadota bacterium]
IGLAMANTNNSRRTGAPRIAMWLLILVVLVIAVAAFVYREPIRGYADVSTAYSARVACSCRFVAGRSLEDCEKDKLAGMELVTLVDDVDAKSVTARFPLVSNTTAFYREGYGCVMEKWEG